MRCTAGFMDEIVEHQDKYIGLPLCADTVNLVKGRYKKLGHCYDSKTGVYSSSIIGSFYRFEKEELDDGEVALVGYARVMKRNKRVCKAIGELFAEGSLKFSFEISCGTYQVLEDDTILIDAADNNFIEGMCIVSFPACPEAVALELVAEINGIGKEADDMNEVVESAEVIAEVETIEPETEGDTKLSADNVESQEAIAESAECSDEPHDVVAEVEHVDALAEGSKEDEPAAENINADVFVTTETRTRESVDIFDNDTGVSVTEVTIHEVRTQERVKDVELVIENDVVAETEEQSSEETSEVIAEKEEQESSSTSDYSQIIAELQSAVQALKNELDELRTMSKVDDSANAINPFVAEISAPTKYSLLESEKHVYSNNAYSLLEKA